MIDYSTFKQIDLKVARIVEAEKVEGSYKLLKLKVDLGGELRQIVAGIGTQYQPQDLLGKEVVVVTNLCSKVLMGLESQGMLLAAVDKEGKPVLIVPEGDVALGTPVS